MEYQPKTGAPCSCKRGVQRDNCPNCEGTGQVIDFAAIRARRLAPKPIDICEVHKVALDVCLASDPFHARKF